jgi:2-keto-4-pentenoate hydratase/2-oxohepta-3-ene-1,7-dioic acid hydratase in catechol pathway
MRIVNFLVDNEAHLGVRLGEQVIDLAIAAPQLPKTLGALLAVGPDALAAAKKAAASATVAAQRKLSDLHLLPPVHQPGKIVCLGTNYLAHVLESTHITGDDKKPEFPPVFMRGASSLIGHNHPILKPLVSNDLDWEAELAVIIGKTVPRHVSAKDALAYVGGYSCFNDGSVRDWQLRTPQWTLGKNFDATGGFGPECVTPDELPPGASGLRIQTLLNGEIMQDSNTGKMIFGVAEALSILSQALTLSPGDVVIMGTCEGVGIARKPPLYMKAGDVCEIIIESIGTLRNPIVNEAR